MIRAARGGWRGLLLLLAACGAAPALAESPPGVLVLKNNHLVAGQLLGSVGADVVRWQGTAFATSFEFLPQAVRSVQFPPQMPAPAAEGEFALELAGGDLAFGRLAGWSPEEVTFVTSQFGELRLSPASIRRISRVQGNPQIVFAGLTGLGGWKAAGGDWQEDGPQVWTAKHGAELFQNVGIPDQAVIEFEISWNTAADFVLALGAGQKNKGDDERKRNSLTGVIRQIVPVEAPPAPPDEGWRLETWSGTLNAVRERDALADLAPIAPITGETRRIHLIAYLDQSRDQLTLSRPDGSLAGAISLPTAAKPTPGRAHTGLRLLNRQGDVRLERLRISKWNGRLPTSIPAGLTRLQLLDGAAAEGEIVGLDSAAGNFKLKSGEETRDVSLAQLAGAEFPPPSQPPAPGPVMAILQTGARVSGELNRLDDESLQLTCPEIRPSLSIPYAALRALTLRTPGNELDVPAPAGRLGRLEIDGQPLAGRLIASPATGAEAGRLTWQPLGSRTGSALRAGTSGSVIYRDASPPPETAAKPPDRVRQGQNFGDIFLKKSASPAPRRAVPVGAQNLHLRSGDVIACTVIRSDEQGVHLATPQTKAQFVPHAKIKALELTSAELPSLDDAKKDRLLTLPRLQKGSPPTHLLCATTGDFLRCRLIALDQTQARVEVQLEEMDIPVDRIARIIWFHPDELEGGKPAADPPPAAEQNAPPPTAAQEFGLVQALQRNGKRMTFTFRQTDGEILSGVSDVLGECQVAIDVIDQLHFGRQIAVAASDLPYSQWKLHPAIEPLIAQDLPEGGGDSGTASPLVGQPAPEIDLELLHGGRFKLSESKGQVVILDFWATWCGPCMQTMPLVEELMKAQDPKRVRLVAVNLEEPAAQVRSVLERHKLGAAVALDTDGVAARRYQVQAIPQLAVIDQTGKVARLYVGGGPHAIEQLKAALAELLGPE